MNSADAARFEAVRAALDLARRSLPPSAQRWATADPVNPGSMDTLADFDESMEQVEYELALYSLAGVARGSGAGVECWKHIEEAARLMLIGPRERARAYLS